MRAIFSEAPAFDVSYLLTDFVLVVFGQSFDKEGYYGNEI